MTPIVPEEPASPNQAQRSRPVRALVRQNRQANEFIAAPFDSEPLDEWRDRLKAVLGTVSDDFVDASLRRLIYACRLPGHLVASATSLSAALALIQSMEPANEMEAMVAVHIASLEAAAMAMMGRLAESGMEARIRSASMAVAKLERVLAAQINTYHRLKHGNRQVIRIEKVEVQPGAQAVVGQIGRV